MSIPQAVSQLKEIEDIRQSGLLTPENTLAIGISRLGGGPEHEKLVAGTLAHLAAQPDELFGEPLHSLIVVGKRLHHIEVDYAGAFAVDQAEWRRVAQEVYGCNLD